MAKNSCLSTVCVSVCPGDNVRTKKPQRSDLPTRYGVCVAFICVCVFVCLRLSVRNLKGKQLDLSTQKSLEIQSMAGPWHALTLSQLMVGERRGSACRGRVTHYYASFLDDKTESEFWKHYVKTRYIAAEKYRKQNTKGPVENSAISQNWSVSPPVMAF